MKFDAVIGHAVLRRNCRCGFFLASAAADEALAVGGVFFLFLAAFVLEQTGTHDLEGALLVLLLAAAVLATHDAAGGDVHDLHGGVGRIDALAAGATRAADFDAAGRTS